MKVECIYIVACKAAKHLKDLEVFPNLKTSMIICSPLVMSKWEKYAEYMPMRKIGCITNKERKVKHNREGITEQRKSLKRKRIFFFEEPILKCEEGWAL